MTRRRSLGSTIVFAALALAACGPSDSPDAQPTTAATAAPAESAVSPANPAPDGVDDTNTPAGAPTTDTGTDTGSTDPATTAGATADTDAPAESEPPADSGDGWLDDEVCSADGAAHAVDTLDGDQPATEVRAAAAESPLPDLTVRRVNCAPGFVNLKNEFPAATPVLFWFWAPH